MQTHIHEIHIHLYTYIQQFETVRAAQKNYEKTYARWLKKKQQLKRSQNKKKLQWFWPIIAKNDWHSPPQLQICKSPNGAGMGSTSCTNLAFWTCTGGKRKCCVSTRGRPSSAWHRVSQHHPAREDKKKWNKECNVVYGIECGVQIKKKCKNQILQHRP